MKPLSSGYIAAFVLLIASGAQARSYNCADPAGTPNGQWELNETIVQQLLTDIQAQHFGAPKKFGYRFCGSIENGEQVIMVGAIEDADGKHICDSSANFAVFYDPRKRTFGDLISGVNLCISPTGGSVP
jgi:hypothetical protein